MDKTAKLNGETVRDKRDTYHGYLNNLIFKKKRLYQFYVPSTLKWQRSLKEYIRDS